MASARSRLSQAPRASERSVSRRSLAPRISFSVDAVVQERFKKMIRFKRVLATYGLLDSTTGSWNLTDRDAVDELVHIFELEERQPIRASMWSNRVSRHTTLRDSRVRCSKLEPSGYDAV
ncbi:unnamed protein product [Effrenium voratum]|nr:unnamed protein product [Effrenium voratum]